MTLPGIFILLQLTQAARQQFVQSLLSTASPGKRAIVKDIPSERYPQNLEWKNVLYILKEKTSSMMELDISGISFRKTLNLSHKKIHCVNNRVDYQTLVSLVADSGTVGRAVVSVAKWPSNLPHFHVFSLWKIIPAKNLVLKIAVYWQNKENQNILSCAAVD